MDAALAIDAGTTVTITAEVLIDGKPATDLSDLQPRARFGPGRGRAASFELTLNNGIEVGPDGFIVTLTAEQTAKLHYGAWQFDVMDAHNQVTRLYEGSVSVTSQILETPCLVKPSN